MHHRSLTVASNRWLALLSLAVLLIVRTVPALACAVDMPAMDCCPAATDMPAGDSHSSKAQTPPQAVCCADGLVSATAVTVAREAAEQPPQPFDLDWTGPQHARMAARSPPNPSVLSSPSKAPPGSSGTLTYLSTQRLRL